MKSTKIVVVALATAALFLSACGSDAKEAATTVPAEVKTSEPAAAAGDIVAVASGNPDFSTLVAAVAAAGLVETLQGAGPYTVFAPTNAAFAALPAGLVDKLLLPENKAVLSQILTYHVVGAKVMAADVKAGDVPTVETSNIAVTIVDGKVMLNETTTVTATDIAASNGVIHVIDSVLLPPGLDVSAL